MRSYASFLLRCWRVGDGEQRIKVEHIQSGEAAQVTTWDAALAWLAARSEHPPAEPASATKEAPTGSDEPAAWRVDPLPSSDA